MNPGAALPPLRLLLAAAYPFLAHAASARGEPRLAALALFDIVLILLLAPLLHRRAGAWAALAAIGGVLWWTRDLAALQLPLLLVPVLFMGLVAWFFARTLRRGRVPLISRIVSALEGVDPARLEPALQRYTRRLTALWAVALAVLAAVNLVLALVAVPRGIGATLGWPLPFTVTEAQWSWFANWLNYGLMGALFVGEYLYRKRRFPGRYRNAADFARRLAALGPGFWSGLFKDA